MVNTQTPLSEQELQANRFVLISRLADDLAHEVRNPLHAVVINLEVLRRRLAAGDAEVALERTAVIEHEIKRVHQIVDQLLRLLRPDRDGDEPPDVGRVLDEVASLLELHAGVDRIAFRYQPCPGATAGVRRDVLRFALLNLSEAVLDVVRGAGGTFVLCGECSDDEVHIRVAADPPETSDHDAAELDPSSVDQLAAAHFHAARLLGEAGRILREERGNSPGDAAFLLLLPRSTGA
jgi:signal transduction histidine kinase